MFSFQCRRRFPILSAKFRTYSAGTNGPNHAILDMLKSTQDKDEEAKSPNKNPYKIRAFTSAIKVIGELDHPIRSADEAKALKGVGPGILRRIKEHLEMSGCACKYTPIDPETAELAKRNRLARAELERIPGVGPVKAGDLLAAGCMSIEQLRTTPQYLDMLSKTQRTGLKYFHHFANPVSRQEAEAVTQFVRDAISPKYEVIIGGSYRRGAPHTSDIDLVILHPDHVHVPFPDLPSTIPGTQRKRKSSPKLPASILQLDLIPALQNRAILAATLSSGDLKWQGIVLLPDRESLTKDDHWTERQRRVAAIETGEGNYRRMDLNLVAQKSRGAALLSHTGDNEFIRDLRIRASKLGLHLNEFGLWRWNQSSDEGHGANGSSGFWELVRAETEEEVLGELGMDYVEPVKRNFSLVLGKTAPRGKKKTDNTSL
ncbi:hypothetical protein GGX14DRAFT_444335 [Mycena pura]|uniref:DNA polymerase n=1 Tax=Mycena pura TaxID=153505 RepID=A0AAD6VLW7_9AGAR|nr:hypothetical protein GGX14DRAFT_444335 [Mycena pura]